MKTRFGKSSGAAVKSGFDRRKSLQELERCDWGEPSNDDTSLVTRCLRLRRKPLDEITAEDLRLMVGQQISLSILIPLAVERLEAEPLVECRFYPGDLLEAVFRTDEAFWASHPDSCQRIRRLVSGVRDALPSLDEIDYPSVRRLLDEVPPSLASL